MKELVVISGKGGTGKTSITACLARLFSKPVLVDADVDASNLHLLLTPVIEQTHEFRCGRRAEIDPDRCTGCGQCLAWCKFKAIARATHGKDHGPCIIKPLACEGCGVCVRFCPVQAVSFPEQVQGQWFISQTRFGAMVHAALGAAQDNSGRLVSLIRQQARQRAEAAGTELILIDGPPGIGCPVMASLTGADLILAMTEPTLSGIHDLERVADLARRFGIPMMVGINKWDINPDLTAEIEEYLREHALAWAGRIRYDRAFIESQIKQQTLLEYASGGVSHDLHALWQNVQKKLDTL